MSSVNGETKSLANTKGWKSSLPESYSRMAESPYYSSSGVSSAGSSLALNDPGTYSTALAANAGLFEGELLLDLGLF